MLSIEAIHLFIVVNLPSMIRNGTIKKHTN